MRNPDGDICGICRHVRREVHGDHRYQRHYMIFKKERIAEQWVG